jgi:hypothetical protein
VEHRGSIPEHADRPRARNLEWASGGAFLLQRVELLVDRAVVPHDAAPDSIAIIGPAADRSAYLQHYFDARGVARVYQMTLDARTWTLTRTTADFTPLNFSQRYTGTISEDGQTITGYWESAANDDEWQKDFDLIYRRETDRPAPEVGQIGSKRHGGEDV